MTRQKKFLSRSARPDRQSRRRVLRGTVFSRACSGGGHGINASPAEAASGRIEFRLVRGGFLLGFSSGSGSLFLRGNRYRLNIGGVSLGATIGLASVDFVGRVRNIREPRRHRRHLPPVGAGLAAAGGGAVARLRNSRVWSSKFPASRWASWPPSTSAACGSGCRASVGAGGGGGSNPPPRSRSLVSTAPLPNLPRILSTASSAFARWAVVASSVSVSCSGRASTRPEMPTPMRRNAVPFAFRPRGAAGRRHRCGRQAAVGSAQRKTLRVRKFEVGGLELQHDGVDPRHIGLGAARDFLGERPQDAFELGAVPDVRG